MSKIEELIAEYCPDGVDFEKFGKVAIIQRGASPRPIQKPESLVGTRASET